jgi:hypothetical protein
MFIKGATIRYHKDGNFSITMTRNISKNWTKWIDGASLYSLGKKYDVISVTLTTTILTQEVIEEFIKINRQLLTRVAKRAEASYILEKYS